MILQEISHIQYVLLILTTHVNKMFNLPNHVDTSIFNMFRVHYTFKKSHNVSL